MIQSISTAASGLLSRTSSSRLQTLLLQAQEELSSGRQSDVGLHLGVRSALDSSLRTRIAAASALAESGKLVAARFSSVDATLSSLAQTAQSALQAALGDTANNAGVLEQTATAGLSQVMSLANSSFDGTYLLSGSSGGGKPLNEIAFDSSDGPGAAVRNAFVEKFGIAPGDSAASSISAADMKSFLDSEYQALFSPTQWSSVWSNASDHSDESRIAEGLSVYNPATANASGVQDLVKSLVMLAGLGIGSLNAGARAEVVSHAVATLGQASSGLAALSGQLGLSRTKIQDASDLLQAQQAQAQAQLNDLESVDPAEVSVRITELSTQLQASYQVTAKLAKLSLVNFL